MRRRVIALVVLLAMLGGTATAVADPVPPPNPSDDDLRGSSDSVGKRAAEVGQLTSDLAALDSRTDDLQAALAAQRESAEGALVVLEAAQDAAVQAGKRADAARVETQAASVAIDQARARLDEFLTAIYQQGLDTGPLGLLTESTSPDDLVARSEFNDLIVRNQQAAQDGLERARVDKANADSAARAALDEARDRQVQAQSAKSVADAALAAADNAARVQAAQMAAVAAQRAAVQARLDAAVSADAGLRDQRARFDTWQRQQAAAQAARDRAARDAAAARAAAAGPSIGNAPARSGGDAVQRVIDTAMAQLGIQYVWGGGNRRGASTGIPDGLGSPLNRVGFDCSGLMLYAFGAAGIGLPRVAENQYNAGRKVPLSDLRAGDMIFYQNPPEPIHHVAMFIGNGQMIEAPYTGANVRIVPLRTRGIVPYATRMF